MKFRVTHVIRYEYGQPVTFSAHSLYLRPRENPLQRVTRFALNIAPSFKITHACDLYDNTVTSLHLWDRANTLSIRSECEVEVSDFNPFDFILRHDAAKFPFTYPSAEQLALSPYFASPFDRHHSKLRHWLDEHYVDRPAETVAFLTGLNTVLYCHLNYRVRTSDRLQSPLETLEQMAGDASEQAILLAELCRALGFAARVVHGYLHTPSDDDRVSPGIMHTWTEVYLPGAGWKGLDPSHGLFCTPSYIAVAHAPTVDEIHPVQGSFFCTGPVTSHLNTRLIVERIH
jgi:Transglutaminase-like enzymes, putative cysteine proteases